MEVSSEESSKWMQLLCCSLTSLSPQRCNAACSFIFCPTLYQVLLMACPHPRHISLHPLIFRSLLPILTCATTQREHSPSPWNRPDQQVKAIKCPVAFIYRLGLLPLLSKRKQRYTEQQDPCIQMARRSEGNFRNAFPSHPVLVWTSPHSWFKAAFK